MPCGGGWKKIGDPKKRDKARRAYYARKSADLKGMRKAAAEANAIMKREQATARKHKAVSLRAKRSKKRGGAFAPF